jgi:hypothetical protein
MLAPETSAAQPVNDHTTQFESPRPQSSIYDRDEDDHASLMDEERKRISIDSEHSIYEEANDDVDLAADPSTTEHAPDVPSIIHSQEPATDIAKSNDLSNS